MPKLRSYAWPIMSVFSLLCSAHPGLAQMTKINVGYSATSGDG